MATLKKAFWFHDAVYGGSKDGLSNEEQSARLWLASGLEGGEDVAALIRVTEHARPQAASHRLQNAMLGADLAILGQPEDVYDTYASTVRAEYSHVDDASYKAGRKNALNHFYRNAGADTLYADRYFSNLYTQQAQDNIAREIATLA